MLKDWFTEVQLALITVYVIVMVDVFGLTLIFPVIVTYAKYLGASAASIGYLYAVYSGMALLCSVFIGRLSDRYGRRAVFLYCGVGALASFIGSAFSTTFIQFAACRAISGLFTGTMGNAYAYIDDLVSEEDKPRYMSYITATMSTCFVVGPIIGGGFAAIDIRAPFVAAAVMALLELVLIWFFVHDPKHIKTVNKSCVSTSGEDAAVKASVNQPVYNPLVSVETQEVELGVTNASKSGSSELTNQEKMEAGLSKTETFSSEDTCMNPMIGSCKSTTSTATTASSDDQQDILSPTTITATTNTDGPGGISPWLDTSALLLGGLGNFLTTTTYCGMATIVPLMLMDPSFGVVRDSNNTDDGLSTHDSSRISVRISYLLTVLGVVQVAGMVLAFPKVSKKIGLMMTGAVGAAVYGVTFCTLLCVHRYADLYPVIVGLAAGFSLCKPVYPAYLSMVAHKDRRADYQAMSMCFNQGAWIFSIVLTQFWSHSHTGAVLYCGGASIINAAMMLGYEVYNRGKGGVVGRGSASVGEVNGGK